MTSTHTPRGAHVPGLHLSASQLRTYADCSLRWFLSRHYRPECVCAGLVFGTAVHQALQIVHDAHLAGIKPSIDVLLEAYDSTWARQETPVEFGKDDAGTLRDLATRMFQMILQDLQPGTVIAVEEPFECHLAEGLPPLVGYIDLIEIRNDPEHGERLHLVDWKTAARRPSGPEDMDPDQLTFYALAAQRTGLLAQFHLPFVLEYRVLTKTRVPEIITVPIVPDHHDAMRLSEKARACWQGMSSQVCFPRPSWQCSGCGYQTLCHEWPDLPAETRRDTPGADAACSTCSL